MALRDHKTKVVATIGPASDSEEMITKLVRAGLDIARLNFSHGGFSAQRDRIVRIRAASRAAGRRISILADLPGPKMRIGSVNPEPVVLSAGDPLVLTADAVEGTRERLSVSFDRLPQVVRPGNILFLNDGLIQLSVVRTHGADVVCTVVVGGELTSRKGLNLPGIDLGLRAFTDHDRVCLEFALAEGVDAVSQSFVETADDIAQVRAAARAMGHDPFIVAKIERAGALVNYDAILGAADGIMVARGDLGVEVPIERMAITQKDLIARANLAGKPVITATQMLESMVSSRLPTRAEATDVANAILDGTDCVMLSAESAAGRYPEEAVATLGRIAAASEPYRSRARAGTAPARVPAGSRLAFADAIASIVQRAIDAVPCAAVFVPTSTGATARLIARHKPEPWIVAIGTQPRVCAGLQFSYAVFPVCVESMPEDWRAFASGWLKENGLTADMAVLAAGPSTAHPDAGHRIEFLKVG